MNFTEFPLDSGLQEGLAKAGYVTCMPVQQQVLENALEGADLYVQSQTGTGKTAAYLVTILQRLLNDPALSGKNWRSRLKKKQRFSARECHSPRRVFTAASAMAVSRSS